MRYLMGIDLGTTVLKTAIVDEEGKLLACSSREYAIKTPRPGWAEQEPEMWLEVALSTTREALAKSGIPARNLSGIGFSGQMHGTVCLDEKGGILRPAIIWADQRSKEQVAQVYKRIGKEKLGSWTANPLATGFMLATLLWLRENEPETYRRTAKVLLPKDYLRYRFTGQPGTEVTDGSSTLLMDTAKRKWSREMLAAFEIEEAILPQARESAEVAGELRREVAEAAGLPEGIPVIYGGGDQPMQALGNGVIRPGILSSTIGTAGQLFITLERPIYDPELRMHTFCHAIPDRWFMMAAILSAGLGLKWLRENVLNGESYGELADSASKIPPGAEGLLFLPYLLGERSPHMDPMARAAFVGLTLRHRRAHLVRAVMEGVVLALREGLELMMGLGVEVERIVASGGGTRHPLWLKLQADIFNREIYQTKTEEAAAVGAALLAGVGVGIYRNIEEACERTVHWQEEVIRPDPENVARYNEIFVRYRRLYPALREEFHLASESLRGRQTINRLATR